MLCPETTTTVNRGVNYAFHSLARLALLGPGEVATVEEIAGPLGVSQTYLAHLMQKLARKRLVVARRGGDGGYRLGHPANSITLRDIALALGRSRQEDGLALPVCASCALSAACPVRDVVDAVHDQVSRLLESLSVGRLASLLRSGGAGQTTDSTTDSPRPAGRAGRQALAAAEAL